MNKLYGWVALLATLFIRPANAQPAQKPVAIAKVATGAISVAAAATAAWLLIAGPFVAGFEGYAKKPYVDTVGTGRPITWCFGETRADGPVPPLSKIFTKQECTAELERSLTTKYAPYVDRCIHVYLPPHRKAALVSAVYNLGPGLVCSGPVGRYINAGNVVAGCNALLAYDHAAGRRVAGLTRRRQAERVLCLRSD